MTPISRNSVQLWIGGAAVLAAVEFGATYGYALKQWEASKDQARDRAHIGLLMELVTDVHGAESSFFEAIATGDASSAKKLEATRKAIEGTLAELHALASSPEEAAEGDVPELRALIEEHLGRMERVSKLRREEGLEAGLRQALTDDPAETSRRIDVSMAAIHRREKLELEAYAQEAVTQLALVVAGGGFSVAVVALSWFIAVRQLRENETIMGDLGRARNEAALLNRLTQRLQICADLDEAGAVVARYLGKVFPGSTGALFLMQASRNAMEVYCTWGENSPHEKGAPFDPQTCWALRQGREHEVIPGEDELVCKHLGGHAARYRCVPMLAHGDSLGVLSVELRDDARAGEARLPSKELTETVSAQVATSLASLTLRESLRIQSVRDPLTGLFNRRYLEETLEREPYRAQRSKMPLSLLMIDVDHFKHFNDTHGHQAGDHMLKTLGGQLRRRVRGEDVACRYGGEEFVVVIPGAGHGDAVMRAESLRHDVAHLEVKVGGHTLGPVTASFGVATFPRDGDNWVAVLEVADRRLYRAKESGRDCVVSADPPEPPPTEG